MDAAIAEGWIRVRGVKRIFEVEIPLHSGELEVISLAKEVDAETVLMDDAKARAASELAGLKPIGTLTLLLGAVKDHWLGFEQFLTALRDIVESGFYLREDGYLKAIQEAHRLSTS